MDEPKTSPVSHEHTHELLDEVLQHTSQQALRLSHLDEGMAELRTQVAALREEAQRKPGPTSSSGFGGSGDQVDAIERDARSAKTKTTWLMALVGLQMIMIGALLFVAFKPAPAPQPIVEAALAPKPVQVAVEQPVANPFAGSPDSPDAVAKHEASAEPAKPDIKKKKKKK